MGIVIGSLLVFFFFKQNLLILSLAFVYTFRVHVLLFIKKRA